MKSGSANSLSGGDILFDAGASFGTNGRGGSIQLSAGSSGDGGSAGDIFVTAGASSSEHTGGSINIESGTSQVGPSGQVSIASSSANIASGSASVSSSGNIVVHNEALFDSEIKDNHRATAPAHISAGKAPLYVRLFGDNKKSQDGFSFGPGWFSSTRQNVENLFF